MCFLTHFYMCFCYFCFDMFYFYFYVRFCYFYMCFSYVFFIFYVCCCFLYTCCCYLSTCLEWLEKVKRQLQENFQQQLNVTAILINNVANSLQKTKQMRHHFLCSRRSSSKSFVCQLQTHQNDDCFCWFLYFIINMMIFDDLFIYFIGATLIGIFLMIPS